MLAAGTYLSGCTDKGTTPGVPQVSKGEPIQFSVGAVADAQSRTVYVDDYQLEWNIGDKIKIWCNEPSPKLVDYVVVDTIYSEHGGAITPTGTDTLKWGELGIPYTFYSAYPADRVTDVSNIANGEFGMEYITNQLDTVVSLSNGAYLTNPDMNNAYMMAKQEVTPNTSQHHVELYFDPIMTTFDITVRAGKYEVATGIINPVTVTGVSVIMPNKIKTDRFTYDANGGTTADEGEIKEDDIDKGVSQSVYVGVRNGTSRYVDLHEGETLNLMAFLPPVDMNANAGGENNKVRIMVHTTGMDYVMSVDGDRIEEQNKYFIQLPDMSPNDGNVNNWISLLDNSTPLKKMSIPTYACTENETASNITYLLQKGVRAFNLESLKDTDSSTGHLGHKDVSREIIDAFTTFLDDNNEEFIIIWDNESLADCLDEYKAPWTPSFPTTLAEARGNIIGIKRYTGGALDYFIPFSASIPVITNLGYNVLFSWINLTNSESLFQDEWRAYVVNDVDKEDEFEKLISLNKDLYEEISTYEGQTGFTGIVTVPYAKDTYVNGQYTYSDLLIQSIIDCNFKFRH